MKAVYHKDYNEIYSSDPASSAGRIQAVEVVSLTLASECDIIGA